MVGLDAAFMAVWGILGYRHYVREEWGWFAICAGFFVWNTVDVIQALT